MRAGTRTDRGTRLRSLAAVSLLVAVAAGCATAPLPPLGADRTTAMLEADERALWKESRELQYKIGLSGLLFDDPALEAYLGEVLERVTPGPIRAAGIEPRVEVISDVNIDGYSFANGMIYIHTGLLAHMRDETQLATLLTRELAHVRHRHAIRAKRDARASADTLAWIGVGATLVEGGGQMKLLAQAASITSAIGFAHELETTADATGLEFLDAAGYAVGGTPDFYRMTLEYLAEVHAQGVWGWAPFAPPPQISARISGMESLIATRYPNQVARRGPSIDASAFQARIHPATIRQAELELAAGLFLSAAQTAELATGSAPRDARAWMLLGQARMGQRSKPLPGRPVPSIQSVREAFEGALSVDPRNPEATRELGMTYYRSTGSSRAPEDARAALRHLREYKRLAPDAGDVEYVDRYIDELERETR
jgi:predicted Zn-dependent protease